MELAIKYQGKVATSDDIEFIKNIIADNPNDSRRALSKKLIITELLHQLLP